MNSCIMERIIIYVCFLMIIIKIICVFKKWNVRCDFRRYDILDIKGNKSNTKHNIMILMLCTSNYDHVCNNSIHQVSTYSKIHNYKFKVFRNKLNDNLHINFSKFEMVKQAMISYPEIEYFVMLDADVIFTSYDLTIESLIYNYSNNPNAKCFAPVDTLHGLITPYFSIAIYNTSINAGLMIWRRDASDLLQKYLYVAEHTKCGTKYNNSHPRNQNVWDICFRHILNNDDMAQIPWELAGVSNSKVIYQNHKKSDFKIQHSNIDDILKHSNNDIMFV